MSRITFRKLDSMMKELQGMKVELLPNETDIRHANEMKQFDAFQKKKHTLNVVLKEIRTDVDRLIEHRKQLRDGERTKTTIQLSNDNTRRLKEAHVMWKELETLVQKEAKKKKSKWGPKKVADRLKMVEVMCKEMTELLRKNSGSTAVESFDAQYRSHRDQKTMDAGSKRRKRKIKMSKDALENDFEVEIMTAEEQAFNDQVELNYAEQEELLTQLMSGLAELQEIAVNLGRMLEVQGDMFDVMEEKMDHAVENVRGANKRLKQILQETGGMERWCPLLICFFLLLGLGAYIYSLATE